MTIQTRSRLLTVIAALSAAVATLTADGADPIQNIMTMSFGDIAEIRKRAEAGDTKAQVTLANSLTSNFKPSEALPWYRKAVARGNVDANYELGKILLFGAPGIPAEFTVKPNAIEGLRHTFFAATNLHPSACWNMSKALRQGLGTSPNLVSAYAWLKLFSETGPGSIVGRVEMNELALKLDSNSLQQAQNLAARFKAGAWQSPVIRAVPEGDPRLKLNGITLGKTPLAVINGKTLSEGESARIPVKPGNLNIRCLNIERDSVTIEIDGEETPRRLQMQ